MEQIIDLFEAYRDGKDVLPQISDLLTAPDDPYDPFSEEFNAFVGRLGEESQEIIRLRAAFWGFMEELHKRDRNQITAAINVYGLTLNNAPYRSFTCALTIPYGALAWAFNNGIHASTLINIMKPAIIDGEENDAPYIPGCEKDIFSAASTLLEPPAISRSLYSRIVINDANIPQQTEQFEQEARVEVPETSADIIRTIGSSKMNKVDKEAIADLFAFDQFE